MTFDDIPDSAVWPDGIFQVRGEKLEWVHSSNGKLMASVSWVCDEPDEWAGNYGFNNFVIGQEDDLEGARTASWKKFGPRKFKEMTSAAQMQLQGLNPCNPADRTKMETLFPGTVFLAQATVTKQKEGDYAGVDQNNWSFYKVGTRQVGMGKKIGATPVGVPQAAPLAPSVPAAPPPQASPVAPPPAAPPPQAAPAPPMAGKLPCGNSEGQP